MKTKSLEEKIEEIKGMMKLCEICGSEVDFLNHYGNLGGEGHDEQYLVCSRRNQATFNQCMDDASYNETLEDVIYILEEE